MSPDKAALCWDECEATNFQASGNFTEHLASLWIAQLCVAVAAQSCAAVAANCAACSSVA